MFTYDTVTEAVQELRKRGFTEDLNLTEHCLMCRNTELQPHQFEIKEVYRFEGDTDPGDEAVVYGIEAVNGLKGILVNGYGYQSEPVSDAIAKKLNISAH